MKTYLVKEDFWIGEINKGLKSGETVDYDDAKGKLVIGETTHDVKNLKAAIKAAWLIPTDGVLPELDGPVGETAVEEADRKRKERFAALKDIESASKIVKDDREIARIVGGTHEEGTPEYYDAMGIDQNPEKKGKFTGEVIEDDTVVIVASLDDNEEVKQIKKAMNQEEKVKKDPSKFCVDLDHHNDGMIQVAKYVSECKEETIKTWSQLHWTKKADVIKTADKDYLSQIREVESSAKIIARIDTRLQKL